MIWTYKPDRFPGYGLVDIDKMSRTTNVPMRLCTLTATIKTTTATTNTTNTTTAIKNSYNKLIACLPGVPINSR